ncbi:MAG: hypothetical protein M3033_03225 [Acidobacteriota bacterium]|nr:hypothetical protein [Acidobacteriota bacterium]
MNSRFLIRKALSMCLVVATMATYSMVALANSEKIAGEILINGKTVNGQNPSVKVNGETAQSGRSIFSASTIATPEDASAVVNLGKIGKIELEPNTILSLTFDEKGINGNLAAGRVTVLNALNNVTIKIPSGEAVSLNTGESASAASGKAQASDDNNSGHLLLYSIILGGAVAGIIFAARTDNNRIALGGGTTIVSATR